MSDTTRRVIHPDCCEEMRKYQSISLSLPDSFYGGDIETPPIWRVAGWRSFRIDMIKVEKDGQVDFQWPPEKDWPVPDVDDELTRWAFEAKYCPYCGEHVPPIVPRTICVPERIAICSDGGYYCDTCSERLMCCQCYPPQWRWMPYKYYPEFGDNKLCRCGHHYYRHFDPFDDPPNRAVGCKYCDCHIFEEQK